MKTSKQGSLLGGTLLIGGSCIGAAMLGLPIVTASSGFIPSQVMFVVAWAFMLSTGLLMLEVNLWMGEGISIVSMADRTLGKIGRYTAWIVFLFLFYTVMIALISGSGSLIQNFSRFITDEPPGRKIIDVLFVAIFGVFTYFGTGSVDRINRILMLALLSTYVLMLVVGLPQVSTVLLSHHNWSSVGFVLPVMIFSFGYHNLIPTLTDYMHGDSKKLCFSLILGSLIPLVVYLYWQTLILGTVPVDQMHGMTAPEVLQSALGSGWLTLLVDFFSLFAALTTLIGVVLSFVDFLADGLKWENQGSKRAFLCLLVLVPPLLMSTARPDLFITALNVAGGFGAVTLFGLLPPLMVWRGRYHLGFKGPHLLPGGKLSLIIIMVIALIIVGLEALQELGLSSLPPEIEA